MDLSQQKWHGMDRQAVPDKDVVAAITRKATGWPAAQPASPSKRVTCGGAADYAWAGF